jgi:hemolysin activation/secretion protein
LTHHLLPLSLALALALGSHITGWTQIAPPDAGSIRQQIEQQRTFSMPQALPKQRLAPPPEIKLQTGVMVKIKAFRFAGNTLLGDVKLAPVLADFVNRELDFAGLQRVANAVATAYREAGWIVRVYLPEQDISEGVITLQIVEAKFAGLRTEGAVPKLVKPSEIETYFKARQVTDQPLNANALDRALLLADDLPGVSVAGTLVPGQADGETALVLQTTDEPFIYGDVGLDNTGSQSLGSDRLTLNMAINSPGGRGELVNLTLLHTQGSDYSRVALTVPAGHDGLRLGVNASELNYKVINGPGSDSVAQIQGNSGSLGLALSYPLVRASAHNLYLSAALDRKSFYTSDTQVRSDYESQSLSVGLSGNRFDELGGGGANSASVQMFQGRLTNMQAHSLKDTIGRDYTKLNYSFSRQQTLTTDHSLLVSLLGQHATQVLDSSEKFYIGGAQTVRAYPVSELGGERGQMLSGEWRWRLAPTLVLSAFMDIGRVVALAATASDKDSAMILRGHGLSIAWQTPVGLSTRLTWARRDGSNPKPTLTGLDGDGTLKKDRVWFIASLPF